ELNPFLKRKGRFFNGGHCPTVGIGGFLLQGGQGWNARGWGWSCQYIEALDVVTADGQLLRASETENEDLFWAARGAEPGFFGVVTCFYLKTKPRPKCLTASTFIYPAAVGEGVLKWLLDTHGAVDPDMEIIASGQIFDFGPGVVVHALSFAETPEAGRWALLPFENCP
ncbi:MAG: FAD-binding protein, partial [Bacteroidota bacterium]